MEGMGALWKEVLEPGICVACGGCVGLCPYMSFYDGRVVCTDRCDREEGRCYEVCPRVIRGEEMSETDPIGPFLSIHRARNRDVDVRDRAQYGGVVSGLLLLALEENMVDEAVLTTGDDKGCAHGVVAATREEVMSCAGSRYAASAVLEAFNKRAKNGPANLAVVGLPCQAQSLALAKASPLTHEETRQSIGLTIGIFCTWALAHRPLSKFLREEGLIDMSRSYDIPPPPANVFQVFTLETKKEYPLDRIRPFVQPGCALCPDMTSEKADVSVGAVEGMEGWNTLIVRTEKGKKLVDLAIEKGVLEVGELPAASYEHLKEASLIKRGRGFENQKKRLQAGSGSK